MANKFLNECVALVTGGSTGIGFSCAEAIGHAGAQVVLTARTEADGRKAEDALNAQGLDVIFLPQDVAVEGDWARICREIDARFGRLDFLINNAGIAHLSPIEETSAETALGVVGVNLIGAYYGLVHAVPAILDAADKRAFPGMVVNISSVLSRIGQEGIIGYGAAKGGMAGMNVAFDRELRDQRDAIRVMSLLPGYTMTPQVDKAMGRDAPLVVELAQKIALRRWAEPEEVAATLMMMLDPDIDMMDTEVLVDGGFLAS